MARHVLDTYFKDTPNPMVRHHLDSYRDLLVNKIPAFIRGMNPLTLNLGDTRFIKVYIGGKEGNVTYVTPTDEIGNAILPHQCRLDNKTYSLDIRMNIEIEYIFEENHPTIDGICSVFDQTSQNYECMVIHNNAKSNKITDQVFWYKAAEHPPFRLCDDSLWVNNAPFSSTILGGDDFDPSKVQKRNAGPQVWVKKTA
jgi:hypothetical protein